MTKANKNNQTKKASAPNWKKSKAKELLFNDISSGATEGLTAEQIYDMKPEYQQYDFTKFKNNLRSLKARIKVLKTKAESDNAALAHDFAIMPPGKVLQWDGSDAQKWLKEDVQAGRCINQKPADIWRGRVEYQMFEQGTFRQHLYQEIRSKKQSCYWANKLKNKKNKKKGSEPEPEIVISHR